MNTTASHRRLYETTVIINAALEDADIRDTIGRFKEYIESHGGEVQLFYELGRRRLAYPIKKRNNGYYVYAAYETHPTALPLLERLFELEENFLRHLTLQIDQGILQYRREHPLQSGQLIAETVRAPQPAEEGLAEEDLEEETEEEEAEEEEEEV
ncbi:MAG: 30S ribosomal protein S6 [Candidatus Kapabacteria bacterium]|nr:30S ribosomal protein S6 [Candidatus Kapabacteria bacterium]MCS7169861.1 30S ribosomal protein S6 [Candidatus Kapabacteria bacterium]MDW7996164.1 30S ribosomal protein S6 [Bacteroidota bacterium]MDW8224992.1 30S ribosomal protein S6 [Bacteroidota bacterium]